MTRAADSFLIVVCAALACCSAAAMSGGGNAATKASRTTKPAEGDAAAELEAGQPATADAGAPSGGMESVKPQSRSAAGAKAETMRLRFTVLTHVQHERLDSDDPAFDERAWGPRNMGAIWISKPDGTFVRSLELWRIHQVEARQLTGFTSACDCMSSVLKPDVMATATLSNHRVHVATWDLTNRHGDQVADGAYTLHIEVADYSLDDQDRRDTHASNAAWSFSFDTLTAPKTVTPPAQTYFSNLTLELFAPP